MLHLHHWTTSLRTVLSYRYPPNTPYSRPRKGTDAHIQMIDDKFWNRQAPIVEPLSSDDERVIVIDDDDDVDELNPFLKPGNRKRRVSKKDQEDDEDYVFEEEVDEDLTAELERKKGRYLRLIAKNKKKMENKAFARFFMMLEREQADEERGQDDSAEDYEPREHARIVWETLNW